MNETIYSSSHLLSVEEVNPNLREITFLALLDEGNALTNNDGTRIPQKEIDEIKDIAVVWYYENDDLYIDQIYNHDTGEIYWDYDHACADWKDGDDLILSSLLMWGELESTIGGIS